MIIEKINDLNKIIINNDPFSLSEIFHENSKLYDANTNFFYNIDLISKTPYLLQRMVLAYKTYPGYPFIQLPKTKDNNYLKKIIKKRRSERTYLEKKIKKQRFSDLMYYSFGISSIAKGTNNINLHLRVYPSAGALYPIEVYIAIFNVEEIEKGIYHYNVLNHSLEQILFGDYKEYLAKICLAEDIMMNVNMLIILSAIFKRTTIKYGIRGYRFALIEAGIVSQNITMVAEGLGLGSCMLGGFYDDEIHKLLKIDGVNEAVVNVMTVGYKKTGNKG